MDGLTMGFLSATDFERAYAASTWLREREGLPNVERVRAFLADENTYPLAAFMEDELVGMVIGYRLRRFDGDADELFVHAVDVAASHRRQGIGQAMMEFLKASLHALGFGEMWLITDDDNPPALALYNGTAGVRETENCVVYQWIPPAN